MNEQKLNSLLMHGKTVVRLPKDDKGRSGEILAFTESRGYQTNYKYKNFFYFILYKNDEATDYKGITNITQKHTLIDHWREKGISYKIVDQELFDEFLNR